MPGEAAERDERRAAGLRCGARELFNIDPVLDRCQIGGSYGAERRCIRLAAGDDPAVGLCRLARDRLEIDLLKLAGECGVEEAAVGRGDEGPAMDPSRRREIVEEEVNPVDVDKICFFKVAQYGRRERIAGGAIPRQSQDRDAVHLVSLGQGLVRALEQAIESDDAGQKAEVVLLGAAEVEDAVLQSPDRRRKLTNHVNYAHRAGAPVRAHRSLLCALRLSRSRSTRQPKTGRPRT